MQGKFKTTKFRKDDSDRFLIRYQILPSGKEIAFGIAGTDLSTLQFGDDINFDKESDEILEKFYDSKNSMAFRYIPNAGFIEVDINKQQWFVFNNKN